jgi:hypothetical protein
MRQTLGRTCGLSFALILCASTIFPDTPEGYQTFDSLKDQFTIAVLERV